jgi:G:T-mismatch repair DNA endonuclease (very short patch repair protein)
MLVQRFQNGDRWAQIARDLHCSARLIRLRAKQLGLQGYLGHRGVTNGMYGRTHTPETVEKLRQASQRQFSAPGARETQALLTIKQIQDGRTGKALNKLETRVARMFDAAGLSYQQQYALGRFVFDFYLPATHTLVEVHGTFWHADPRKYEPDALSPIQQRNVANDAKKAAHAMACGYALTVLWEADMP